MTTQWPPQGAQQQPGRPYGQQSGYGQTPQQGQPAGYGAPQFGQQTQHGQQTQYGQPQAQYPQQGQYPQQQAQYGHQTQYGQQTQYGAQGQYAGPYAPQRQIAQPTGDTVHLHQQFLGAPPAPKRSNIAMNVTSIVMGVIALITIAVFIVLFAMQGAGAYAFFSLALALLPISFVWAVVWFIDRWEPEPPMYLLGAVFWGGGVAVGLALLFSVLLTGVWDALGWNVDAAGAVVGAPLAEESMKGLGLLVIYFAGRRHLNGPVDGIVYGALIGAGFAFTENLLYFTTTWAEHGVQGLGVQFFFRGIALPLLHPICVSLTGAAVGWAARRYGPGGVLLSWLVGLIPGMLLHGTWNGISTMAGSARTGGEQLSTFAIGFFCIMFPIFLAWIGLVVYLRRGEARILRERLSEYAAVGWYSPGEVEMLTTMRGRTGARRWARSMSPEMGRAMREFISESSHLAVARNRLLRNASSRARQADEAETLAVLTGLRRRLNAAQSAYVLRR
ncbi:Protease PrsW [Pseudoclavibacter triregionum]|nr:Protease PrsW [Pseudoclavibacter triregionum]